MKREYRDTSAPFKAAFTPTRFEYFVGMALQGLVTGRSEKDLRTMVRKSIELAREVENELGGSSE
jgi:hypothetical protein